MISLVNPKEVIILLVISQKNVGLGKGTTFQHQFKAHLLREAQMQSYPDAELPRREATQSRESTGFFGELIPK